MTTQRRLCVAVCFSLIGLSLQQKADLRLEVEPRYTHVTSLETPVTLTCTLRDGGGRREPLAACGFRHHGSGVAWDIGTGSATINHTIQGRAVSGIITNPGNKAGSCSLKIAGLPWWTHMLGCRVRPAYGGAWRYAAMLVLVENRAPWQYRLQPTGVLESLPGSDVTISGEAEGQVYQCGFYLPPYNTGIDLYSGRTSKNTTRYRVWIEGRQCAVTLWNIQPSHSGFVYSWLISLSLDRLSADFMELIVATPPESRPLLTLNSDHLKEAGDILHATCVVKNSRPVANITWLLGGDVIRADSKNEVPVEGAWRWNYEPQTILQRLSRRLTIEDDGKVLKCQAGHLALPGGFQNSISYTIRLKDPCTPNPCGPYSECHVVGTVVACSCQTSYIGRWPSCRPECDTSSDCPAEKACVNHTCITLCPRGCGQDALCRVINHESMCECPQGFSGDPKTRCEEEPCGVRNTNPALVSGGHDAIKGEWPWHAAIFEVLLDGTHRALCGGTLVKENVVVTAAHCVFDEGRTTLRNRTLVKVVLGKLLREWEDDLDDLDVQRLDVDTIHVPEYYIGFEHDYRLDIALIKLSTNATLGRDVNVACVDWGNTFGRVQLRTGSIGTVAGWGLTSNSSRVSPTLKWIDLPWVDPRTCRRQIQSTSRRFFTHDKFCAGYLDRGRSVCKGDSGGGLLFLNATNNRYYLRGVVSTSLAYNTHPTFCHADHYTAFTSVGDYVEWIEEQLTDLS